MKATKSSIGRTVAQPDSKLRFYLFYGPDDAQSRGLGQRLVEALAASRFVISGSAVKADLGFAGQGQFWRCSNLLIAGTDC